ncbi:hypothetical protein OU644_01415, partial [Escherichia coli]|nr:hypothetical protein [Escherichia coli]
MLHRYISATPLAAWLKAMERAHQRAAPSLPPNQRFRLYPYLYQLCIFHETKRMFFMQIGYIR